MFYFPSLTADFSYKSIRFCLPFSGAPRKKVVVVGGGAERVFGVWGLNAANAAYD